MASPTGTKQPPPHGPVRVALVLRLATPRRELEHAQHLGVAVERLVRQRGIRAGEGGLLTELGYVTFDDGQAGL